jgi:hypothetical protein
MRKMGGYEGDGWLEEDGSFEGYGWL